jgi:hypothetical protein
MNTKVYLKRYLNSNSFYSILFSLVLSNNTLALACATLTGDSSE